MVIVVLVIYTAVAALISRFAVDALMQRKVHLTTTGKNIFRALVLITLVIAASLIYLPS